MTYVVTAMDVAARELALFAAVGFAVGGVDDLLIDLIFALIWLARLGRAPVRATDLVSKTPGRLAIFVPAWDEAAVIGPMLRASLARLGTTGYTLYVGAYPNDPDTLAAIRAVRDARLRLVINPRPGPTTKADNLNSMWRALVVDEAADGPVKGVVLHDAEDMVPRGEPALLDALLDDWDAVQLPVVPLIDPRSRWVGAHYADEFSQAHGQKMVVRQALGAALPFAGTGCAFGRAMLARIAATRGGVPFDADSLTEDYELGLLIHAMGGRTRFARLVDDRGEQVAVRAYFPATWHAAIRQKARWTVGIALAGWDRTGWGRAHAIADHWMRLRDRRVLLGVIVTATGYAAALVWGTAVLTHLSRGEGAPAMGGTLQALLDANAALLGWRLLVRAGWTGHVYGRSEALRSIPRAVVGNVVALLAAGRAVRLYRGSLRGVPLAWDKTAHHFPLAAE